MASTQEAFDHHVQGFVARDVSVVVKDFDEGSLVIAKGEIFRGLAAVRDYSTELFEELPKDCDFEITECIVLDKSVYIVSNAESETVVYDFATDTGGLIVDGSGSQLSFTTFAPNPHGLVGSTNVADRQWHHVAIVYDGQRKILYVDGEIDAQEPFSSTISTNDVNVRLGFNAEYTGGQCDGLLDEVRIYSRALSKMGGGRSSWFKAPHLEKRLQCRKAARRLTRSTASLRQDSAIRHLSDATTQGSVEFPWNRS